MYAWDVNKDITYLLIINVVNMDINLTQLRINAF